MTLLIAISTDRIYSKIKRLHRGDSIHAKMKAKNGGEEPQKKKKARKVKTKRKGAF